MTALLSDVHALRVAERSLQAMTDGKMRIDLEGMQLVYKRELSQHGFQERQLRTRGNEAMQLRTTEQGRWIELNARLDELERLLGPLRNDQK
jgi:hypothetical protein